MLRGRNDKNATLSDTNEAPWLSISGCRTRGAAREAAAGGDTQISREGLRTGMLRGAEGPVLGSVAESAAPSTPRGHVSAKNLLASQYESSDNRVLTSRRNDCFQRQGVRRGEPTEARDHLQQEISTVCAGIHLGGKNRGTAQREDIIS